MKDVVHKTLNGVNVDQLLETIEAVKNDKENAVFKFRAKTKWMNGARCKTEIKDFYGVKQEDNTRDKSFILEGDEPSVLLGSNIAPNAVEIVLHALGSCLSVGFAYNAAARGININSLSIDMEGELDLQRFLGITDEIRPGYKKIDVKINADTDAEYEDLYQLMEYVKKTSPVMDIITNSVPVKMELH